MIYLKQGNHGGYYAQAKNSRTMYTGHMERLLQYSLDEELKDIRGRILVPAFFLKGDWWK